MTQRFTRAQRAAHENHIGSSIAEYGCFVLSVFDPDGDEAPFSYSVGIAMDSGHPEVIVFGLSPKLGAWVVNEYNRQVRAGKKFRPGVAYRGFLEGFPVYVEPASPRKAANFMFACNRLYGDFGYPVVQVVIPSTAGAWPWEKAAPRAFRRIQPLICQPAARESSRR
ncbi:DUF4262 domain-containing protein [Ramlibacter pallidus]|uniref:DUF4262 domain-containing protein n=1 Tax=Ramlibacter pallidus TaxID=2780087 RepID=A0ABR9S1K1_9BURK|nr:DUF4262 domain-containing protein [Ramlibacter pallidus]MBE7367162.1 DUF4262 domain-containing protein [Ramlibacter pallidus]